PVHAASLVNPATHSPELMQLIGLQISRPVIEYIVDYVFETVNYAMGPTFPSPNVCRSACLMNCVAFVSRVLSRADVAPPALLTALVYITRARPHLSIAVEEWALERVFLGALMIACKYTNDSTLKNAHWALCTGVFSKHDVGRIEREFLGVLNWELGVSESNILVHYEGLVA
ncbi:hypothetical protein B0H11DRAFT_1633965, partial [Mycena galericulata]